MANKKKIQIRMYNVGFGDSFLITIPAKSRARKVLVDCGSHTSGKRIWPMKDVVGQILSDIREKDGSKKIDVVIATHRHQDHVSGFDDDRWSDVEVGEVWMPWTEHPKDPKARKIRETQSKVAKLLLTSIASLNLSAAAKEQLKEFSNNSLTNAKAMDMLHDGFSGNPERKFLPEKDQEGVSLQPEILPGVTVHVMGPYRDAEAIRDMDPPSGQSYLRFMDSIEKDAGKKFFPFQRDWIRDAYGITDDEKNLLRRSSQDYQTSVAVALEKAVNGTSLMLLFQINRVSLLFPGDAQWGTWSRAMDNPDYCDLIKKAKFFKIGHHGSHNATPVKFVQEVMPKDSLAMVSTSTVKIWPKIPKTELLNALHDHQTKLIRSDKVKNDDPPEFKRDAKNHFVDVFIALD